MSLVAAAGVGILLTACTSPAKRGYPTMPFGHPTPQDRHRAHGQGMHAVEGISPTPDFIHLVLHSPVSNDANVPSHRSPCGPGKTSPTRRSSASEARVLSRNSSRPKLPAFPARLNAMRVVEHGSQKRHPKRLKVCVQAPTRSAR